MVLSELVHFLRRRVRPPESESEHCLLDTEPTCCSIVRLPSPQRQHIDALLYHCLTTKILTFVCTPQITHTRIHTLHPLIQMACVFLKRPYLKDRKASNQAGR
ncbi:unnamed protein product [Onchocerca flexuosa]|uniref:Secreted protein n=1 Tax=Onchocerca flexuosa TaxID=387005 RepID=A0A183H7F1_9BILA|nr:unnamed protein product [Onchocerca flexuosa]